MDWIMARVDSFMMKAKGFFKDSKARLGGDIIGAMIGLSIGVYVIAYVLLDAALAVANKTGFSSTLSTLVTTVMPILLVLGAIVLIYKKSGLGN